VPPTQAATLIFTSLAVGLPQKHDFDVVQVMTCAVLRNDWITLLYQGYFSLAFLPAVQRKSKFIVVMATIVRSKEATSTCHEESIVVSVLFVFPQVIVPCKGYCV